MQLALLRTGLFWRTSNAVMLYFFPRSAQVELELTVILRPVRAQTTEDVLLLPSGVDEGPGTDTDAADAVGGFVTLYAEKVGPQVLSAD